MALGSSVQRNIQVNISGGLLYCFEIVVLTFCLLKIVTGQLVSWSNTTSTWRHPLREYGLLVKLCLVTSMVSFRWVFKHEITMAGDKKLNECSVKRVHGSMVVKLATRWLSVSNPHAPSSPTILLSSLQAKNQPLSSAKNGFKRHILTIYWAK